MKVAIVFLAVIVAVYSQAPKRCKAPPLWEAREMVVDPMKKFEVISKFSYDELGFRNRRIEEVRDEEGRDYYDTLYLHNIGKEYRLNLKTRKCEVREITWPFRYIAVPENATNYGEAYIGTGGIPGEGVLVTFWGGQDSRGDRYAGTWTYPACIPVSDAFYSNRTGFVHASFFDVTVGVSDPNVFIPPKECNP